MSEKRPPDRQEQQNRRSSQCNVKRICPRSGLVAYNYGGPGVVYASFGDVTFVPEPSTFVLLLLGLIGLASKNRRSVGTVSYIQRPRSRAKLRAEVRGG